MSVLLVTNGYQTSIQGLGKNRGLENLSQKRISVAVRGSCGNITAPLM